MGHADAGRSIPIFVGAWCTLCNMVEKDGMSIAEKSVRLNLTNRIIMELVESGIDAEEAARAD
jgi:hypothetical protein